MVVVSAGMQDLRPVLSTALIFIEPDAPIASNPASNVLAMILRKYNPSSRTRTMCAFCAALNLTVAKPPLADAAVTQQPEFVSLELENRGFLGESRLFAGFLLNQARFNRFAFNGVLNL
jgi:hypothetical protein